MRVLGWLLLAIIVVGGGTALVRALSIGAQPVVQPVAFNHAVHIEEARLECMYCHTDAARAVHAGLPGKQICLDCHDIDEEEGDHAEKDKLFAYSELDEDLPWIRVATTTPDVFFSHQRHVTGAGLDCLACHTDQPELESPPSVVQLVMKMADCIDCHRRSETSHDCLVCHR